MEPFDLGLSPSPSDQHPLEVELLAEWQALQLAMKHTALAVDKIIAAWKQDRTELNSALNRLEALTAKRAV